MNLVPSINALKHASLVLRSHASTHALEAHIARNITKQEAKANVASSAAHDYWQAAEFLDQQAALRSTEPTDPAPAAVTEVVHRSVFEQLKKDSEFLNALRAAGVDNWEGYSEAQRMLE